VIITGNPGRNMRTDRKTGRRFCKRIIKWKTEREEEKG